MALNEDLLPNLGRLPNDGLGDDLRTSFLKINDLFRDLYNNQLAVTGKNLGTGAVIFKEKNQDAELELRSILGSANVTVTQNDNDITISSPLQNLFSTINIPDNSTVIAADSAATQLTIQGGTNTTVEANGKVITINVDTAGNILLSNFDLNSYDIFGVGNITINGEITANNFEGDFFNRDGKDTIDAIYSADFGNYTNVFENAFQVLFMNMDYDMGTIATPSDLDIDMGTF